MSSYGPIQGSAASAQMPIERITAAMQIGDRVTYRGSVLVLVGLEPMSVPNRRAQVEDPATGEYFEVAYDELEELPSPPQGFDPAA
jgi:hypothetical protein